MAVALGAAAIGGWAVATGQISYEITHGVSMNPLYHQGDLVFLTKADSYDIGDIAAYHGSSPGLVVLHRIIGGDATGFVFKGDNNTSIDPPRPSADALIGRAVLHVPKGGLWLGPLLSPTGLGMIGFMIVSGGAAVRTRREIPRGRRKKKVKAMSGKGTLGTAAAIGKAVVALPPLLRAMVGLLATAGLLGIGLAVLGWMGPLAEKPSGPSDDGQRVTFAYETQVPRSPAYDDTVVTSPEPVFRKLAHHVDVHVDYRGRPGSMDVVANLATTSGWHTRMQLLPEKAFSSDRFRTTVRLDLDRIDGRAREAATAIGVGPSPVTVTVLVTVTSGDGAEFTPALPLTLTPLQLTVTGGAGALVVDGSAPTAGAALTPRVIGLGGYRLTTAPVARSWAVWLLLGAVLGGIGTSLVARRRTPVHDSGEIHRRFPQLLVAVEPMASPPGKPVVNVDDFQALVRLAERYGQLILHWSRNGAETFVVRDEGITYRYRTDGATQPTDRPELQSVERPARRTTETTAATEPAATEPPAADGEGAPPEGARQPGRRRAPRKTAVGIDLNQG